MILGFSQSNHLSYGYKINTFISRIVPAIVTLGSVYESQVESQCLEGVPKSLLLPAVVLCVLQLLNVNTHTQG
jgi:hypothetical protein